MSPREKRDDLPGLGGRLREARENAGLSQAQAARILGVHRPAITEIEAETRKVSAGELAEFATAYRVDVHWLLVGSRNEEAETLAAARRFRQLEREDRDFILKVLDSLDRGRGRVPNE